MRIGIDFDDTVASSVEAIIKLHNGKYGTTFKKEEVFRYRVEDVWGGSKEEWRAKLDEFFSAKNVEHLDPMAGSIPAIEALKKAGHELWIVTARSDRDIEATELWLKLHFPGAFEGVHYGQALHPEKTRTKAVMCKENGIELLVDDHLTNAEECAAVGVRVLLIDQPWNQGELPAGVERVHSWAEVVERVGA